MSELLHTLSRESETSRLILEGEVDISNTRVLRTLLCQALQQSDRLWVDLTDVLSMDSSGIATLIEAHGNARRDGKAFRVIAASERVRLALKLLCLEQLLMEP